MNTTYNRDTLRTLYVLRIRTTPIPMTTRSTSRRLCLYARQLTGSSTAWVTEKMHLTSYMFGVSYLCCENGQPINSV